MAELSTVTIILYLIVASFVALILIPRLGFARWLKKAKMGALEVVPLPKAWSDSIAKTIVEKLDFKIDPEPFVDLFLDRLQKVKAGKLSGIARGGEDEDVRELENLLMDEWGADLFNKFAEKNPKLGMILNYAMNHGATATVPSKASNLPKPGLKPR